MPTDNRDGSLGSRLLLLAPLGILLLPLFAAPNTIQEDALITARYARNLATGHGLVYNVGERVLGTTTPAWAILTAWIFWIPVPPHLQAMLIQVFGCLVLYAAFRVLVTGTVFSSVMPRAMFLASLGVVPALSAAAIAGMETTAVMLCVALLWQSLCSGSAAPSDWWRRAGLSVLLLFLRLDSVWVLVAVFTAFVIVGGPRALGAGSRSGFVGVLAAVAGFLACWCAFSYAYYGHVIPQSMMAKTRLSYADGRVPVDPLRWVRTMVELLGLDYPWPSRLRAIHPDAWWTAVWVGAIGLAWTYSRRNRSARILLLASVIYLASFSLFLSVGQATVYPWYTHVATFLTAGSVLMTLVTSGKARVAQIGLAALLVGFLAMGALNVRGLMTRGNPEHAALRAVGQRLQEVRAASVMLEPIGYVGFYSSAPVIYDLGGLVSPDVFALRRTGEPGWFAVAVHRLRPDYVVLRDGEVEQNVGFNVGQLFRSTDERSWWDQHYGEVEAVGEKPGRLSRLVIYKKISGP